MLLLSAPDELDSFERPAIFLGGGITGAPNWQPFVADLLSKTFATCFNPRRPDGFTPPDHPDYLQRYKEQVHWEHKYLLAADVVLFWLPKDAASITTRFEVGWWFGMNFQSVDRPLTQPFVVGIEPGVSGETYYRVLLAEINVPVHTTLQATCDWACQLVSKSSSSYPGKTFNQFGVQ